MNTFQVRVLTSTRRTARHFHFNMASTDEFALSPDHPILDILSLGLLEYQIYGLKPAIPLSEQILELFTVHAIRKGDLPFFEYLMKNERMLCPNWSLIGSLSYQFLLCQACEYSQPDIVKWLLSDIPNHHRFPDAEEERRASVQDMHLMCDRRRHVDYQWPLEAIKKSGSAECFRMFQVHAPLSLKWHTSFEELMKT